MGKRKRADLIGGLSGEPVGVLPGFFRDSLDIGPVPAGDKRAPTYLTQLDGPALQVGVEGGARVEFAQLEVVPAQALRLTGDSLQHRAEDILIHVIAIQQDIIQVNVGMTGQVQGPQPYRAVPSRPVLQRDHGNQSIPVVDEVEDHPAGLEGGGDRQGPGQLVQKSRVQCPAEQVHPLLPQRNEAIPTRDGYNPENG